MVTLIDDQTQEIKYLKDKLDDITTSREHIFRYKTLMIAYDRHGGE